MDHHRGLGSQALRCRRDVFLIRPRPVAVLATVHEIGFSVEGGVDGDAGVRPDDDFVEEFRFRVGPCLFHVVEKGNVAGGFVDEDAVYVDVGFFESRPLGPG